MTDSLAKQTFTKSIMMALLVIPTAISILLAIQIKNVHTQVEHNIVCFTNDNCAIHVNGVWYKINGVIDMDSVIPQEYKPLASASKTQKSSKEVNE